MRRVLVLTREDMIKSERLTKVDEVFAEAFDSCCRDQMPNFEVVLFHCSLTEQTRTIKNRYGHACTIYNYTNGNTDKNTNKSKLLDFIMIGDNVK